MSRGGGRWLCSQYQGGWCRCQFQQEERPSLASVEESPITFCEEGPGVGGSRDSKGRGCHLKQCLPPAFASHLAPTAPALKLSSPGSPMGCPHPCLQPCLVPISPVPSGLDLKVRPSGRPPVPTKQMPMPWLPPCPQAQHSATLQEHRVHTFLGFGSCCRGAGD